MHRIGGSAAEEVSWKPHVPTRSIGVYVIQRHDPNRTSTRPMARSNSPDSLEIDQESQAISVTLLKECTTNTFTPTTAWAECRERDDQCRKDGQRTMPLDETVATLSAAVSPAKIWSSPEPRCLGCLGIALLRTLEQQRPPVPDACRPT